MIIELTNATKSAKHPRVDNDADGTTAQEREDERIAAAGRKGRRVGTVIMVVFGAWFVATTVYNFAVGVFGEK